MNFNLTQSLSEAESVKAQSNLYSFFVKHLKRYTLGDSSSVPSSTASEIFTSVCFVLKSYFVGCGVTYSALAQEDSEMLFKIIFKWHKLSCINSIMNNFYRILC